MCLAVRLQEATNGHRACAIGRRGVHACEHPGPPRQFTVNVVPVGHVPPSWRGVQTGAPPQHCLMQYIPAPQLAALHGWAPPAPPAPPAPRPPLPVVVEPPRPPLPPIPPLPLPAPLPPLAPPVPAPSLATVSSDVPSPLPPSGSPRLPVPAQPSTARTPTNKQILFLVIACRHHAFSVPQGAWRVAPSISAADRMDWRQTFCRSLHRSLHRSWGRI